MFLLTIQGPLKIVFKAAQAITDREKALFMIMRKQNVVLFQIMVKKIVADNPDISMEDLIQEVSPKATDLVSDRTRREMAEDVKVTLEKAANE